MGSLIDHILKMFHKIRNKTLRSIVEAFAFVAVIAIVFLVIWLIVK